MSKVPLPPGPREAPAAGPDCAATAPPAGEPTSDHAAGMPRLAEEPTPDHAPSAVPLVKESHPDPVASEQPPAEQSEPAHPAPPRRLKRWRWAAPLLLALTGAIAYGAYRYARPHPHGQPAVTSNPARSDLASDAVRVEVVAARPGGMGRSTTQTGSVTPFEYSTLYAKVSGYLRVLNVDIGDHVQDGQELAVIDVPELHKAVEQAQATLDDMHAQKKQAEARLKAAQAGVKTAESAVAKAQSEVTRTAAAREYRQKALDRIVELARRNSVERRLVDEEEDRYRVAQADEQAAGAGVLAAQAQLAEARAKVELAQADVEDAAANIHVAEADLGKARVLADYTVVTAPYHGVITQRGYHRGDFIRNAAEGLGEPLLTVAKDDVMRIIVQVPERDVPYLNPGDPATLRVDALGDRVFQGRVARIAYSEDTRDRTMRAEIDLPNPDGALVGGMYGYATIELEPNTRALTIPSSCLVEHGGDGRSAVFIVRAGKAKRIDIQVGRDNGIEAEVLKGLTPDDLVIDRGVDAIADGTSVHFEKSRQVTPRTNPAPALGSSPGAATPDT